MEKERKCTNCGKIKPISEFHKTSRKFKKKDGKIYTYRYHHAKCNVCRRLDKKEWYRQKMDELNTINC